MKQNILIVTGMHRSGTSLITRILNVAGFDVGKRLMPPAPPNKFGFFEDLDFWEFQDRVLKSKGYDYLSLPNENISFSDSERKEAFQLISERETLPNWGWKDPRHYSLKSGNVYFPEQNFCLCIDTRLKLHFP